MSRVWGRTDDPCELAERDRRALRALRARVALLEDALRAEAALLDAWASESHEGGWSTHQVDPMRRRAAALRALLGNGGDLPPRSSVKRGER